MQEQPSQLSFSIVDDEASFEALETEWNALFQRAHVRTPFLRYHWMRLCWQRQHSDRAVRLFVVTVRDGERIVLIAPLVAHRRLLTFRTLYFLDSLTPQYNDVLVEASPLSNDYVSYLWTLLRRQPRVLGLRLNYLREDSLLVRQLASAKVRSAQTYSAPYINLTQFGSWGAYFDSRSANLRQEHRRRLRQLKKTGAFEFRFAGETDLGPKMAWLFAMKRAWVERRSPNSRWLSVPGTEELFTAAATEGLSAGRTWLSTITISGRTIAAILSFREDRTIFFSKTAFDPAWQAFSPGRTLLMLNIKRGFEEKVDKFDLMIGEGYGKERVGDEAALVVSRRVGLRRTAGS